MRPWTAITFGALRVAAIRSFMIETAWATRKIFNPRYGSPIMRQKLALVLGFLATGIVAVIVLACLHKSQADEARSTQTTLNQIAVITREINTLTWSALQEQRLTLEADSEMRAAKKGTPQGSLGGTSPRRPPFCPRAPLARTGQLHCIGRPPMDSDASWKL